MKMKIIVLLVATTFFLNSCAKIYHSPDANSRANSHQIIAIAPPKVAIAAQKKVTANAIKEQQKTESTNFQKEMHSWLLKRKMQNRITVNIQDVTTTNAKLLKAGYDGNHSMTPNEICEVLGVDAIITSDFSLSRETLSIDK